VFRRYGHDGRIAADILAPLDADPFGEPLMVPIMRGGEPLEPRASLEESRDHARRQLAMLPEALRSLSQAPPFAVEIAPELRALAARLDILDGE